MSSHGSREEARGLSVRTLAIASMASALAALIVSQFWQGGTPIAAAVTPVLVALISEMLHKPTAKMAERVTVDRAALRPRASDPGPEEARRTMPLEPTDPGGDVRVYRSRPQRRPSPKVIALTGGLAFMIAVAALTLPELIAGQSLGNSDRRFTIGGGQRSDTGDEDRQQTPPAQTDERPAPETTESETQPKEPEKTPEPRAKPDEQPEPETTAPAPKPRQAPEEDTTQTEPVPEEPALPGAPPAPQ